MTANESPVQVALRARPFAEARELPPHLRVPFWLGALIAALILGGIALGLVQGRSDAERAVTAVFFGAAFAYAGVSTVDFWEHFRLEKEATGRWLAAAAVPVGESLNHLATTLVVVSMLVLVRRPPAAPEARDLYGLVAPALFLALGWRDELVYHRRRAAHREDIMHTTAHLAAGVMLAALYAMRLVAW